MLLIREWVFENRGDAGAQLARRLARFGGTNPLVLAIPRGGVPVAAEIARRLDGELDVIVARKLGSPMSPELGIGAVTANGGRFLNDEVIRHLQVSDSYVEEVTRAERAEARRREDRFRGRRAPPVVRGRTVILVDDGLATGGTMRAAVRSVRSGSPARLIVAVPVGSPLACAELRGEADEVICVHEPEFFGAVGGFYRDFRQTEDDEVERLLRESASSVTPGAPRRFA
jgi:predicted phosphoribosyltransferase